MQWYGQHSEQSSRAERLKGDHVVALAWVRVDASDWFGTLRSICAGPVRALVAVGPAGTTVAAQSHGVAKDRVGVDGAARQDGGAVFDLIVGAAPLDKEAPAKNVPHVAVLVDTHKHKGGSG